MIFRRRPWKQGEQLSAEAALGPLDSLITELDPNEVPPKASARLPGLNEDGTRFWEMPLPGRRNGWIVAQGIPDRPRLGAEPKLPIEVSGDTALARMTQVLARVHELEIATDQPDRIWSRLRRFWLEAEQGDAVLMSEIVRQADVMPRVLDLLMTRLRRILRRERDRVPLDRVQEMDTGALIWLTRQPGRSLAEKAGPDQRIQAVVRRESFDTGENRVLRAYCRLAAAEARDWLRHNRRAARAQRYLAVQSLASKARRVERDLEAAGVRVAEPGLVPNFVLTQDPDYRRVYEGWVALLREKRATDDLWAWQHRSWSDFVALAVTLSLQGIEGAELVASCPIGFLADHDRGSWFATDTPLAVFHLRQENLIVEVQYRPAFVARGQDAFCAPLWLRIGGLQTTSNAIRVPVWPRLVFQPLDLASEAQDCAAALERSATHLAISAGLIVCSDPASGCARSGDTQPVEAVGLGASGVDLKQGMDAIGEFLRAQATAGATT